MVETEKSVLTLGQSLEGVVAMRDDGAVLLAGRCTNCSALTFPRSTVCPSCMSEMSFEEPMPRRGKLYSWTAVHVGSPRLNKPIMIGYVDLDNGLRVFSHLIASTNSLAIDQTVELSVADIGETEDGRPIRTFVFSQMETAR